MDGIKLLATTLLFISPLAVAEVYKCTEDGKTIYSQDPCSEESEIVDLSNVGSVVGVSHAGTVSIESSGVTKPAPIGDHRQDVSSYLKAQELRREITKLEYKRNQVFKERDLSLKQLKQRKNYANNNLAGASWEQSLSQEMQAVTAAADSQISSIDRQIASFQQQLNSL